MGPRSELSEFRLGRLLTRLGVVAVMGAAFGLV